ncbi:hypothetical protein M501DRAFT_879191 [Patellaria atrata CBS 101060]|uniref:Piwi domain-containing protein n=1 Tax=Patellaria atrata CBS 101060 TaxID=1346257 RepID=A0A9P4SAR4_9PEZI|nr:hypothetical protein M501DRAFT_879191 [Patellaria atrata CBS 101060]
MNKANLVILIMNRKKIAEHALFKRIADRKYGLHSLCITEQTIKKAFDMNKFQAFMGDIALKINLKSGGINHAVENLTFENILVIGADVTHPGPASVKGTLSVTAMVGNVDRYGGRFLGSLSLQQESRQEMILNFESLVPKRIEQFCLLNNKWPKSVIYYRDGVSESQYTAVREVEVSKIRPAAERVWKKHHTQAKCPRVEIAAIVATKRHHVRFYPIVNDNQKKPIIANSRHQPAWGKQRNCPPGTLVKSASHHPIT